jgi:hypothetical protein
MVATRSQDAKGSLDHIITSILVNDKHVKEALDNLGVIDVYDLLSIQDADLQLTFETPDLVNPLILVATKLLPITARKILQLQEWYNTQQSPDHTTWFQLTPEIFNQWRSTPRTSMVTAAGPATVPTTGTLQGASPSFRQNVKINISDYPKLKEDQQWRAFNRQLKATAANHDTLEVLDPTYYPAPDLETSFDQKQKFMYNVFVQSITTTKGKICVRAHA